MVTVEDNNMESQHLVKTLDLIRNFNNLENEIKIDGHHLTISEVLLTSRYPGKCQIRVEQSAIENVKENASYLEEKVKKGYVIYGVNTGFGGSADVRNADVVAVQTALVRHLNAGFGEVFAADLPRGVMLVRANSLARAMSGVRPQVLELLVDMINHDIVPQVPVRGSVSASGDLMPTSYITAAMSGRQDCKVLYKGTEMMAPQALQQAGLNPATFQSKEALAVLNSCSFAASLGACVVYEANLALLLTEVATAMSVEALKGRVESFHPTIHQCMPHPGQVEVAGHISALLDGTSMAITQLDMCKDDCDGVLKQDRYALRTAAQWLGPVAETLQTTMQRILVDLNSTNDNPIIDHHNDQVLHGGNFQGTALAVAMDQTRQALQLCGKLMFAQMSEIVNVKLNNGLTPNLAGSDVSVDFGFKGMDTAMASYQAELDWMTNPVTNHVLSAEIHNQSVNSLALVSARKTTEALDILYMMLTNILVSQAQAIDLRYLQTRVEGCIDKLLEEFHVDRKVIHPTLWPWYNFAFTPEKTAVRVVENVENGLDSAVFINKVVQEITSITQQVFTGKHVDIVSEALGKGNKFNTKVMYCKQCNCNGLAPPLVFKPDTKHDTWVLREKKIILKL